ncbi:acylneuraminate cytidylyltransferase family protein [uncultured Psychrosphaera sp.]|jgi:CMP-N-acetylneuraminic acid synthetase|uniref:acylneuraminate cytidylyltransferase family protein n=1 Tax=uncultured Psychrosphaera sp. TaxID=1403522 RepID=UPI00262DD1AE|nr:acylneuraminate cytidylyltransferase family protein [uncultured Psychrosphaera sp.]
MIYGKKVLAIIPARGGSKRLPKKNILDLAGKPLISWTINAALSSQFIDKVMVTTDDKDIADISRLAGAEVPFMRKKELSSDTASSIDVALDVINFYEDKGDNFDSIILLQPTSPLRTSSNIDEAIEMYHFNQANYVISVAECDHSPLWCNTLPSDFSLKGFISEKVISKRSQDLEMYYRLNGAIYICNIKEIRNNNSFFSDNNSFAYVMKKENSVDIDDEFDFMYASLLVDNYQFN